MSKFKTIAIDSAGELARACFSKDMGKVARDMSTIRAMQNYPGTTERLNMFVRRCKDYKAAGIEIVFTAHEDIQQVYAKGGMMAKKGEPQPEPAAVKGWPDLPGRHAPDEFCRSVDNIFRVRFVNGQPAWVAKREIMVGEYYWDVKDRFNAPALRGGYLPASYTELAALASQQKECFWDPPYVWILYGTFGIGKTRSLLTFPRPLLILDLDRGTDSIRREITESKGEITVIDLNPEDKDTWEKVLKETEAATA